MTGLELLKGLHEVCQFQSKEGAKIGKASNSELRRWLQQGAVEVNGHKLGWDEVIDFPIMSLVMFPKKHRTTLL